MKIEHRNKLTILTPDDGFKYITNGEIWSTEVYLGRNDKIENWHDTNEEPPDDEPVQTEDK